MSDASESEAEEHALADESDGDPPANGGTSQDGEASDEGGHTEDADLEALRKQVEEKYDFDNFTSRDMAEMTAEEWDVAFDAETWITGPELLERVENELKTKISERDVFATLEYATVDGTRCLVAYSDTDYAIVFPNGTVEGRGTVVRDVKPTVALCSMDSYDVAEPPENWHLPEPASMPEESSELGNWMLQLLAGSQILIGLAAIALWITGGLRAQLILGVFGAVFIVVGLVLFLVVANARLSERFRSEQYEQRLRSIGSGKRPSFLPLEDEAFDEPAPPRDALEDGS